MSRVGKQPVQIPDGITVTLDGAQCVVKGPKGTLSLPMHERVKIAIDGTVASVTVANPNDKRDRALWGLYRVLLSNLIEGVQKGFSKQLEIRGVGFRAAPDGKDLLLNLGFSHPIKFVLPEGITAVVEKNIVTIAGIDKQLVGETAAKIRKHRPPEPYKGKGIRYVGEFVRQKAGKVVKTAGAK